MNREIKFRAWDKRTKSMLTSKQHYVRFNGEVRISVKDPWNDCKNSDDIILMQYTNLKDSNGKAIYEGDIISYYILGTFGESMDKQISAVRFDIGCFVTCEDILSNCFSKSAQYPVEIIGNIYQNPELLEVNK